MTHTKLFITLVITFFYASLSAQQDPYYNLYNYNMNLVNPAYAGAGEANVIGLNFKSQWANIEGAPETQSMFMGFPMGKNVGLGASVVNGQTFIEKQTDLFVDFSYKVRLSEEDYIYFGLKGGFNAYNVNTSGLATYQISVDPSLTNVEGSFTFNAGVGILLKGHDYFLSLSIPKILQNNRLVNKDGTATLNKQRMHIYLAGGFDIPLTESIMFKPSIITRSVVGTPLSFNITTLFDFSEQVELGASYRVNESFSGLFVLKAIHWADIGYAYEVFSNSAIQGFNNGTHEIMFNLKF